MGERQFESDMNLIKDGSLRYCWVKWISRVTCIARLVGERSMAAVVDESSTIRLKPTDDGSMAVADVPAASKLGAEGENPT
jgi:hypothetical protein